MKRAGWTLAILAILAPVACSWLPTGATGATGNGVIRQFVLPPGNPARLELGSARRLIFAVSASDSADPSFQFRIQSQVPPNESRFRAQDRRLFSEPGAFHYPRRIQAGGNPTESFWINIGDSTTTGDRQRTATRRVVTPHAYVYTDSQGVDLSTDQVTQLANAFETTIYPTVTRVFGADPATDAAGDSHVYVVLSPAVDNFGRDPGLMGYFWSRDLLSSDGATSGNPRVHSNLKKVIFLTSSLFAQQPATTFGSLAHEFTHLCVYNQKVLAHDRTEAEAAWLDEGWAMLAMDLCGYGLRSGNGDIARDIKSFEDAPSTYSLTDWFNNPHGYSYGQSFLFSRYLYDRFGAGIIPDVMASDATGVGGVQSALAKRGLGFQDVFADWAITNAIAGLQLGQDPRYGYAADLNLRGTYGDVALAGVKLTAVKDFPVTLPGSMRPWGTTYYDLTSSTPRGWTVDFRNNLTLFGRAATAP